MICFSCKQPARSLQFQGGDAERGICWPCRKSELKAREDAIPADERWRNTKAQRAILREKFGGRCAYCGNDLGQRWHADHLESVTRVGDGVALNPERNAVSNMMPACAPCNLHKSGYSLEEWREYIERSADILRRGYSTFRAGERFGVIAVQAQRIRFHFEQEALGLQEPSA